MLLLGAFGGYEFESSRFEAFKVQVATQAKVQQATDDEKAKFSQNETKETLDAYAKTIAGIHSYYSGRVLNSAPSGKLPNISIPALRAHETASNGSADSLMEQCADTTAQLLALQDWVNKQVMIYGR
jgi:hypothetical protein